jgi:phage tail-like protein
MRLTDLTATARPEGNQIELTWNDPGAVRVVRRRLAYPEIPVPGHPAEGIVVADSDAEVGAPARLEILVDGRRRVVDTGLAAETVYYYAVFPHSGTPPSYDEEPANRVSAMATGCYDFAGLLHRLLPAIYHRYDTVLPEQVAAKDAVAAMDPVDRGRGQLRRFLDLPGGQLDQIYSAVRSLPDLIDVQRVDGRLLPLLAQWIGWRIDHRLGFLDQRAEIRNAPDVYRTIGTVPGVQATVLRITGRGSRTKEFVDNVALTNRPERLNLWLLRRLGGSWDSDHPELLSLDDSYGGLATVVTTGADTVLCYSTVKAGRQDLWQKIHTQTGWIGSEPVTTRPGVDRDPALAVQGDVLWLFWATYDDRSGWRMDYRTRLPRPPGGNDATADPDQSPGYLWSGVQTLTAGPEDIVERRSPAVQVDGSGALWLFWRERSAVGWTLRYNRFTGQPWAPTVEGAKDFPAGDGKDPRVESDVSLAFRPAGPGRPARICVLWSRQENVPGQPGQSRWRVVSRTKDGTDFADADWGGVVPLPVEDVTQHDREPSALIDADGALTVFWSSTRDGSWSVWQASLDLNAHSWGTPTRVTGGSFSDRWPLACVLAGEVVLTYRSNRALTYRSARYATTTVDGRYSGATTLRTTNAVQIAQRGSYDDFTVYTYDAGRTDADLYARDTVGIFLDASKAADQSAEAGSDRLRRALPEFLPATARAVLLPPSRESGPTDG